MATSIPHLDKRTVVHLPPLTSNLIILVANRYKQLLNYAIQPSYDNCLARPRWNDEDIVPIQDSDSE